MKNLFWLGLLLAVPAHAGWQDLTASDFSVPPPPAKGSADYVSDIAAILSDQNSRTPEQCRLGTEMNIPSFTALYTPSGILTSSEMSAVQPFLDQVSLEASKITDVFKKEYSRPRPYNEDSRIKPCAPKPGGATSYPSAHSVEGAVDACVLGRIFPDRAAKLTAWGQSIGQLRVIVGVHHPSDVAAGQALAADICADLLQQSDFVQEVDQLKSGL